MAPRARWVILSNAVCRQGYAVTEMGEQMAALFNLVTDEMRDDAQHKVRFSFPV